MQFTEQLALLHGSNRFEAISDDEPEMQPEVQADVQPPTLLLERRSAADWVGQVPLEETRPSRLIVKRRSSFGLAAALLCRISSLP